MVTQYGMSESLGPLQLGQQHGEVFLGRDFGHQANYSDEVAARIDEEVRRLVESAHDEARSILTVHREVLDHLATELVERETLDTEELHQVFGALPPWPKSNGNGTVEAKKRAPRARRATT
jgi:cell division protease FtsH